MPDRRSFLLVCGATLFEFLALGVLLATLPAYVTGPLGGNSKAAGLAVGAFSVSAVVMRPLIGQRIDRTGRRRFLITGSLVLATSSLGLYLARSIPLVVVSRLGQGLSTAFFYTAASTVVSDLAPADRRSEFIGRFSFAQYIGFAVGPPIGEQLARSLGYGWAWGTAAASAALAATVGLLIAETATPERVAAAKAVPRRLRLAHPGAVAPGVVLLCGSVAYVTITTFAPVFADEVGLGSSGPLYAVFAVVIMVVRLFGARLADRIGARRVVFPAMLLGAVAYFLLATFQEPWAAYAMVIIFGGGFALVFPALMALTASRVPDSERAEALGTYTAFFDVGAAIGGFAVGAVADAAGFGAAFCVPAVLCLLGAAIVTRVDGPAVAVEPGPDVPPLPEPAGA